MWQKIVSVEFFNFMSVGDTAENRIKKVVGVKYDSDHGLPQVTVKGTGRLAEEIIEKRKKIKGDSSILKNVDLVDSLYKLPLESDIQPELFELVAAVLVHVYSVEAKKGNA